ALAHASLMQAVPPDGAILAESPRQLRLTFNEPIAPTVVQIIGPNGDVITPLVAAENAVLTVTPPALRQGTHTLSWRVVSADGHPVGGALVFSVGAPSAAPPEPTVVGDPLVADALWAAKVAIYIGLFIGIGGIFFGAWLRDLGAHQIKRRHFVVFAL